MWFTVEDALAMPVMREARVITGHEGLGRNIRSVTVLDAPDATQWLQGHELALTSTFPLTQRQGNLALFVEELVSRNVAGLGVKLNRYMTALPSDMLSRAHDKAFPIIQIPDHIAWIDIMSPVLTAVLDSDARHLIRTEEIRSHFTRLLFSGADLVQLLSYLNSLLQAPVFLISPEDGYNLSIPHEIRLLDTAVAMIHEDGIDEEAIKNFPDFMRKRDGRRQVIYTDLSINSHPPAYIATLTTDDEPDTRHLQYLLHARDAILMHLLRHRSTLDRTRHRHHEFMHILAKADLSADEKRARIAQTMHRPVHDCYFAVVIKFHDMDQQACWRVSARFQIWFQADDVIAESLDQSRFLLLIPGLPNNENDNEGMSRIKQCLDVITKMETELAWNAGASQLTPVLELDRALEQADYALKYGLRRGDVCKIRYHAETSLYQLLERTTTVNDAKRYINDWLGPVIAHDKKREGELLTTLRVFLENSGAYRKTAGDLNIHHNTVRYRIARVHALTRRKTLDPKLYLQFHIALILHDIFDDNGQDA